MPAKALNLILELSHSVLHMEEVKNWGLPNKIWGQALGYRFPKSSF